MGLSALAEGRRRTNIRHRLLGMLRQAVHGRRAGYEDVNDAERLACNLASFLAQPRPARHDRIVVVDHAAREAGQDRRPDRVPRAVPRIPAGRDGSAAADVHGDPAPDRASARTIPLRWPDKSGPGWRGRSRGENHAPRSTDGTRVARIRLRAGVERLLASGIHHQLRVPLDQRFSGEAAFRVPTKPSWGMSA